MTIDSNIYPPIFYQSYMPAFIYTEKSKVYFAISAYNTIDDLHGTYPIQVIVQDQKTNQSILDPELYPSGIKLTNLFIDTARETDDKYYIELDISDIKGGFALNEYYKVQIRFTSAAAAAPPSSGVGIDGWLSENINHFSQWSSVVLIYGISTPSLSLNNFEENEVTTFTNLQVPIVGKLIFEDEKDKEKLRSYQIFLYDKDSNQLLQDSGVLYPNSYQSSNEINYYITYNIQNKHYYFIKVSIKTNNLYNFQVDKEFYTDVDETAFDVELQCSANNISGYIKICLKNKYIEKVTDSKYEYSNGTSTLTANSAYVTLLGPDSMNFNSVFYDEKYDTLIFYNGADPYNDLSKGTKLVIRRSSSRNNFQKWETISNITISQDLILDLTWDDYTVEPGVWYKYKILRYNSAGFYTSCIYTEPLMVVTEDIFLESDGKQLKIRFDPEITNFSIKVSQSLTETIGSQYPFVRRNGNVQYRTFNLSGTITHFMNAGQNLFKASKKDLYKNAYQNYADYNQKNKISPFNDFIYQKQFRKKVIDFLYKDDVKLFRSLTEGNIMVKLMNISFTPNTTLSRQIYSFSCTVYEIMDVNQNNYQKNGIINNSYSYTTN